MKITKTNFLALMLFSITFISCSDSSDDLELEVQKVDLSVESDIYDEAGYRAMEADTTITLSAQEIQEIFGSIESTGDYANKAYSSAIPDWA